MLGGGRRRRISPKGATAIVMDPQTGAILALANWPRVNANDPARRAGTRAQNRAVGFTYEPGSTFKAFTVAGALQDGHGHARHAASTCRRQIQVADRTIHETPRRAATRR